MKLKLLIATLIFAVPLLAQEPTLANSNDIIAAKDRANHTGTQPSSTLSDIGATGTALLQSATPAAARNALIALPAECPAPRTTAKIHAIADTGTVGTNAVVSIFATGDSLGNRVYNQLTNTLGQHLKVVGLAMESLRYVTSSGTVSAPGNNSAPNFEPTVWDTGRVWAMSDGSALVVGPYLGGTDVQPFGCNQVKIVAAKQSGGGTLTVEYSTNYPTGSPTWTSMGTVDTAGAAGEAATGTFTLGGVTEIVIRISVAGGPAKFVGAKMLNTNSAGLVLALSNNGGLRIDQAITGSAAVRAAVVSMVDPDMTLVQFREGAGELDQTESDMYFDNLIAAKSAMDILLLAQHREEPSDATADVTNGFWAATAATRHQMTILPTEQLLGGLYAAYAAGFRDPATGLPDVSGNIGIHLADGAWARIANAIISQVMPQSPAAASFVRYYKAGTVESFVLAEQTPGQNGGTRNMLIPGHRDYSQSFSFNWRRSNGLDSYWRIERAASNAATGPLGLKLDFQGDASALTPMSVDANGYVYLSSVYSATPKSAYTAGAQLAVENTYNAKGVLLLNHTSATSTWIQRWQREGTTQAEMREDGELNLKTITTPDAYADDAAAATGGVPVGGIYRKTDGTVVWRQS